MNWKLELFGTDEKYTDYIADEMLRNENPQFSKCSMHINFEQLCVDNL